MRAFLSHSSKDKGYVDRAASMLKPGTFELDSVTFDAGLINTAAITEALKRSDLFCLFLSRDSITSKYVEFETLLAIEFLARGGVTRFLVVCLDEDAFNSASTNVKFFNIIRRVEEPENAARLIQGALVAAASADRTIHPFIGREDALGELESQVVDSERPATKALFVSGNFGIGRRSLVRKFYQDHYPHVGRVFPVVEISEYSGLEEIFRQVLGALRPAITGHELRTRLSSFEVATEPEKYRQIAALFNSVLPAREAAMVIDSGGVLTDTASFQPEIARLIDLLESHPHPPLAFVSLRSIPLRNRRHQNDVAHVGLGSLKREEAVRLASRLLKDNRQTASREQISEIVGLADGHPFNFYRIVQEVHESNVATFLANPRDFIEWKHRQSSSYLNKIKLSEEEISVLALLKILPSIDFAAVLDALPMDAEKANEAVMKLSSFHLIEFAGAAFSISPPLRSAVERDRRIRLPEPVRTRAMTNLSETLAVRIDEGSAEIRLVDSAILASIRSGNSNDFVSAFLLPSHYAWLAKRSYDEGEYRETIRLAQEAIKGMTRLSAAGFVAACRYMCLAASRVGESEVFEAGISLLRKRATDDWAKSNVAFLQGFNSRMLGNLPAAEEFFYSAYQLSPGNHSAARELAAVCLARGNLEEAEKYAREAREHAARNVYVLDILIAVLTKRLGRRAMSDPEVRELFDLLQEECEGTNRSFFETRKAELENLYGDNGKARELIAEAIDKTPYLIEPRRILAEIFLKEGNKVKADEVLRWMRSRVMSNNASERRWNYRSYLETYSKYLTEVGKYEEAKDLFRDPKVFTDGEQKDAIRRIEIEQGFRKTGR